MAAKREAMKHIVFTVTNDLTYDQRMNRICTSLAEAGYSITLIGRKRNSSSPLPERSYRQKRLFCWFSKGKSFYLEYNFRLFLFLLTQPCDIICGIDLDTILPTWLAAKIKRKAFVYDAHEFFTEMEEVVNRPLIKKAWLKLEQMIIPKVKYAYTVSDSYAHLFEERYGTSFEIIRNATLLNGLAVKEKTEKYILYQGAVNVGRGLEKLIVAMKHIDCKLIICGQGDVFQELCDLTEANKLQDKVIFKGYIAPDKLKYYTAEASIGVTLFSNKGLSNKYSLANRFFDYIHASVPQVAMNYPEYRQINSEFEVASLLNNLNEESIADAINRLLNDEQYYLRLKNNCKEARKVYNWQNEEQRLLQFYKKVV